MANLILIKSQRYEILLYSYYFHKNNIYAKFKKIKKRIHVILLVQSRFRIFEIYKVVCVEVTLKEDHRQQLNTAQ